MWRFILGFGIGVYAGTYYECKPLIKNLEEKIKEYMPNKKS